MRRSIGELAVSRVLDTTGAPPWRLYTQTDGQDRGVCVVAWGLRRSTEYRPLYWLVVGVGVYEVLCSCIVGVGVVIRECCVLCWCQQQIIIPEILNNTQIVMDSGMGGNKEDARIYCACALYFHSTANSRFSHPSVLLSN